MSLLWQTLLVKPLLNALVVLFEVTNSLGISIILFTVAIRFLLLPIVLPTTRNMKKQRDLQPELEKLKKKHKNDKRKQAEAQMELFKKHGLNPATGCVSQVPMFLILIALFGVIRTLATSTDISDVNSLLYSPALYFDNSIDTSFLVWDLGTKDSYYILPVLAGLAQFGVSKYMYKLTKTGEKLAKKTPDRKDDIAYNVQEQMLYMMPLMTVFIGINLPAGVVLYMLTTSVFMAVQNYYVMGSDSGLTSLATSMDTAPAKDKQPKKRKKKRNGKNRKS